MDLVVTLAVVDGAVLVDDVPDDLLEYLGVEDACGVGEAAQGRLWGSPASSGFS